MHIIREIAATNNELIFSSNCCLFCQNIIMGTTNVICDVAFGKVKKYMTMKASLVSRTMPSLSFLILKFSIIAIISCGVICMYSCNNITSSKKWYLSELTLIYDYFYTAGELVPNSNIFDTAQTQVYGWCINISVCPIKPL